MNMNETDVHPVHLHVSSNSYTFQPNSCIVHHPVRDRCVALPPYINMRESDVHPLHEFLQILAHPNIIRT